MNDIYQERYLTHQLRKKELLANESFGSYNFKIYNTEEQKSFFEVLRNRCSQRNFSEEPIDLNPILETIDLSPSSCGRKGILVRRVENKELLSGLLVGGVGWIQRAKEVLFLVADMDCYKNPVERDFMPYLDAGVIVQTAYLTCEVMNYGCCFVNPNIRPENKEFFKKSFDIKDNELFCGALAIGKYRLKHTHGFTPLSEKNG